MEKTVSDMFEVSEGPGRRWFHLYMLLSLSIAVGLVTYALFYSVNVWTAIGLGWVCGWYARCWSAERREWERRSLDLKLAEVIKELTKGKTNGGRYGR